MITDARTYVGDEYPYRWPTHRKTTPGKRLMQQDAWALAFLIRRRMLEEYRIGSFYLGDSDDAICSDNLAGACTIAAVIATMVLRAHGYQAGVVSGHPRHKTSMWGHWWAATSCGWSIDPTYGQFSKQWDSFAERRTKRLVQLGGVPLEDIAIADDHPSLPGNHTETIWRTLGWFGAQTEYGRRILGVEEELAAA
jgi:hypothetical protein